MSSTSEYEPTARQDYGPTTSSENFQRVLEHKLADNMNVSSVRTPVLRALPVTVSELDSEPDSTNPENITLTKTNVDKEIEYHISEKRHDSEMSVDTLAGIVRIEESAINDLGRIPYPIIQETDDLNDGNYIENPSATIIQAPLNSAIVQNVAKLPQNFTINVDRTNITTIQNVSQDCGSNQTLWLPTILATSTATPDNKTEDASTQADVQQIIITSESYINDASQTGRRANIVTETNYINKAKTSKVQILSNISIPKNKNYSQPYQSKESENIYKLNTNAINQKLMNNSVLSTKPKSQSLIGCSSISQTAVVNTAPFKNVSYEYTFPKTSNLSKTIHKVNNGDNLNTVIAATSGNTQCHILSRVVSGPNKMSVHSGRKAAGNVKSSKSSVQANPKNQSRAIKIIQQTGSVSKSENKTWPITYGVVDSNASKIIQKVGSPTHKSQQQMTLQKMPAKGERLVLQSPCGPVLLSTAPLNTSLPKGPHYVQSGSTPNLHYVQAYRTTDHHLSSISQVSANQQLTAQILQSLSQPKLMLQQPSVNQNLMPIANVSNEEETIEVKPTHQKRIVFGDKATLLTANDIIGMEERPNLFEQIRQYTFQSLAFVMLDHTYALPAQKQPSPSPPLTTVSSVPPVISSPIQATAPMSPLKTPPVIMSTASYELPPVHTTASSVLGTPVPVISMPLASLSYKPQPLPVQDDDAASNISSLDGDKRPDKGGSDTETAPEGEEEGKTRCICDFTHDDGYMICCDRCGEWQHVDCMGIDRQNIPDAYMCELCQPRPIDRRHARVIQMRKREELNAFGGSDSDSSDTGRFPGQRRKRLLTVTTYTNTSGSCVTTYNSNVPALPPLPQPALTLPKRGPKKPKKAEIVGNGRKTTKRKLSEKRVKRKKDMMLNRNKYSPNLPNQSHWQESYELAMTNHYSPELRAKIMKYSNKLGNTPNMASAVTAHLCTTVPHAGGKILIATKDLKENTPVIELRGKYMLSNQHRPQLQNTARAGSQKPGPFVFFYRLPKDNTQICIDTRTYGNEARFVRRSCKPNAELQHCIVKGTLHVYLVTIGGIQSNTEITVGHDTNTKQPCACGYPKHCKVNGMTALFNRKSVDYPPREKRSRNRCVSSSSPVSPPPAPIVTTPIKEHSPLLPNIKSEKKSPIKTEFSMMSPVRSIMTLNLDPPIKADIEDAKPLIDLMANEEMKPDLEDEPFYEKEEEEKPELENKVDLQSEEPVKTPIPDLPEEPVESPCQEIKEEVVENIPMEEEEKHVPEIEKVKEEIKMEEEKPILLTKEPVAKSACHDRSSRSSKTANSINQDSIDDKTDDSQDKIISDIKHRDKKKMTREERKMEAIMKAFERMEKAEQRKQEVKERQKRRESDPHPSAAEKEDDDDINCSSKKRRKRKGRARTTSQSASARRRLNSADSDLATSGDEAPPRAPPSLALPAHEDLGVSSACLLVEAAVGSVESAFKLPKTKKTMATEWVGRSPERTPSPYQSPYRPSCLHLPTPSLESLVRVASTMIGDLSGGHDLEEDMHQVSPPRTPTRDRSRPPKKAKRITRNTPPAEVPEVVQTTMPQHSAKKRWLRQAISEESDSPIADVFVIESPPNEMVTPLKKRRFARQSLCDQNNIVPCHEETSPNLMSEDSPIKEDNSQYKIPMYGRDRTRSDSGQGSDDQCHMDNDVLNVNINDAHDSENIRRIIGVPMPEDDYHPVITSLQTGIKTNNNNIEAEENNYTKVVPMEIDTTIPQPKIQESNENSNSGIKILDSPTDKLNSCSADTSGSSSPQRDEMDDIQKKIHSFHTENILFLKSRNKKPPKEKRKKVNLNFDLNMVDDQISIQLRTEDANSAPSPDINGDIHDDTIVLAHGDTKIHVSPENIPLPPVESIPLPDPENIPLPEEPAPMPIILPPETIPLPEELVKPVIVEKPAPEQIETSDSDTQNCVLPKRSTGLFSGIFMSQTQCFDSTVTESVPNMSIIKSAIDRTTILDHSLFETDNVDELKSVQEILTRVNNMDSNNSLLLSGVLKSSNKPDAAETSPKPVAKPYCPRTNDPRLNPPPVDKPKPVRRKLSINEYRKRLKGASGSEGEGAEGAWGGPGLEGTEGAEGGPEWSSASSGDLSPQRLDAAAAAAADDLEQRIHKLTNAYFPKGVFDAQPTASERQRENLSSRLRREFGLALVEDEEARQAAEKSDGAGER